MQVASEVEGKQIEVFMSKDADFSRLGVFGILIGEVRISMVLFVCLFVLARACVCACMCVCVCVCVCVCECLSR